MQDERSRLDGAPALLAVSIGVILFVIFSCAGWIYETVENVFSFGGFYLRASLMLPWCPIYGIGGLIIVFVMEPVRRHIAPRKSFAFQIAVIIVGIFVLTALVELAGSYVCEAVMGRVPWDYSDAWLNFDGRIAPAYTLRFVVLGLIALYAVYPLVTKWALANMYKAFVLSVVLVGLFLLDNVLEAAGLWSKVKDALSVLGVKHW